MLQQILSWTFHKSDFVCNFFHWMECLSLRTNVSNKWMQILRINVSDICGSFLFDWLDSIPLERHLTLTFSTHIFGWLTSGCWKKLAIMANSICVQIFVWYEFYLFFLGWIAKNRISMLYSKFTFNFMIYDENVWHDTNTICPLNYLQPEQHQWWLFFLLEPLQLLF